MRMKHILVSGMITCLIAGCGTPSEIPEAVRAAYPAQVDITVYNPLAVAWDDAPVLIGLEPLKAIAADFNPAAWVAFSKGAELSGQLVDRDNDGIHDHLLLIAPLAEREKRTVNLRYAPEGAVERPYPKRTQAELSHKVGGRFVKNEQGRMVYEGGEFKNISRLRVPPEHTDHTFYIRYEGPGWESDKVGYRFYLDWRNATDIFGKKVARPVLQNVGLDGFDSYHEMGDWGMDILKVGDALGIGAVGFWDGAKVSRVSQTDSVICTVAADGPVYARVRTEYFGWQAGPDKTDLISDMSIVAGDRKTHHEVTVTPGIEGLCTGIVKHAGVSLLKKTDNPGGWGFLATYGLQSLAGDSLGMAVIFRTEDLLEVTEDDLNHVVVLKNKSGKIDFYFLAAWEQEPGGIISQRHFEQYLENELLRLRQPVEAGF